jgi:hypothetical protein
MQHHFLKIAIDYRGRNGITIYNASKVGATTLRLMTFSIMTFSIMTFSIMTFSIMTLSIKGLYVTISINDTDHKGLICDNQHM